MTRIYAKSPYTKAIYDKIINKIKGNSKLRQNEFVVKNGNLVMQSLIPDKYMQQKFYITEIYKHELQPLSAMLLLF